MSPPIIYRKFGRIYNFLDYPFEMAYYRYMRRDWLAKLRNQTILEIGVGTGKNLPYYHESNTIIGIDRSPSMIEQARIRLDEEKNNNVTLILQNGSEWNLPIELYTTVVATFVFCTMKDPKPILDKLLQVTKPGSELILFEFSSTASKRVDLPLRVINPVTKFLFGVDFYRSPTTDFLDNNWKLDSSIEYVQNLIFAHKIVRV